MTKSHLRGWEIYYDGSQWRYVDNDQPIDEMRPCKKCGCVPTSEGYDACLGHIEGVMAACCGHGVEEPYVKYKPNFGGSYE